MLNARCLGLCFARSYLVGAAFNSRGLQNLGLVYAMEPGLRCVYPDPVHRKRVRKSYMDHYNTHLFWTPLLLGVFLGLEAQIAEGRFPRNVLDSVRNTTTYTLSALGDSAFGGSLLVFWSLAAVIFTVLGQHGWTVAWIVIWFAALQLFKMTTFILGLRDGLKVLQRLRRWNLIMWASRLKVCNAALLALFLALVWRRMDSWEFDMAYFVPATGMVLFTALLAWRLPALREVLVLGALAFCLALPWLAGIL